MQYIIEDMDDSDERYTFIDLDHNIWSGSWYTHLNEWDGDLSEPDTGPFKSIKHWLDDMATCRIILKAEKITLDLLQEYPELFI